MGCSSCPRCIPGTTQCLPTRGPSFTYNEGQYACSGAAAINDHKPRGLKQQNLFSCSLETRSLKSRCRQERGPACITQGELLLVSARFRGSRHPWLWLCHSHLQLCCSIIFSSFLCVTPPSACLLLRTLTQECILGSSG